MERQIELGRAVLASSLHNLELWLTTLITLSPFQDSIDIQHFSNGTLLELLTAGDVWVSRGRGLYMDIAMTLRGEPLPQKHLRQLAESMLHAPVWQHLKLQPSLAMDGGYTDGIRICISHCEYLSADNEKERHRIFADIPPSDIQPPASVARLEVNAIRLCMDVLEARPRPPLKRTRTAPTKMNPSSSPAGPVGNSQADRVAAMEGNFATVVVPSPQLDTAAPAHLTRCKSGQGVTKLVAKTAETIVNDEYVMLSVMVDGALRLASCGGLATRQSIGLKVKANTFGHGLADVIPNIWKPGHLLAVSRRACLLPTICRSLSHLSAATIHSTTLKNKIRELERRSRQKSAFAQISPGEGQAEGNGTLLTSIAESIWFHLQRNVVSKSSMTFPVFLALGSQESSPIETNDILKPADDGEQEQWAMIHTPKPYGFQDIVVDSEDDLQLAITVSNVNQTTTAFAMTTEIENNKNTGVISADLGKAFHEGITGLIAQEPATTRNTLTGNDWLMVEQGSGHSCEENDDSSSYDSADQHPMRNNECSSYDEGHGEIGGERIEDILLLA